MKFINLFGEKKLYKTFVCAVIVLSLFSFSEAGIGKKLCRATLRTAKNVVGAKKFINPKKNYFNSSFYGNNQFHEEKHEKREFKDWAKIYTYLTSIGLGGSIIYYKEDLEELCELYRYGAEAAWEVKIPTLFLPEIDQQAELNALKNVKELQDYFSIVPEGGYSINHFLFVPVQKEGREVQVWVVELKTNLQEWYRIRQEQINKEVNQFRSSDMAHDDIIDGLYNCVVEEQGSLSVYRLLNRYGTHSPLVVYCFDPIEDVTPRIVRLITFNHKKVWNDESVFGLIRGEWRTLQDPEGHLYLAEHKEDGYGKVLVLVDEDLDTEYDYDIRDIRSLRLAALKKKWSFLFSKK